MNAVMKHEDVEVLDAMPSQALAVAANPYMAMAQQALTLGKVDQLGQLLDLQQKWEADQARKAFVAAMAGFKSEPMEILKSKQVSFQTSKGKTEYKHAELSDVTAAVVPAMSRHGLSHAWAVKQEGARITVACTLTHAMGHRESVEITAAPDDSGGKNSIQAVASTISYLQRYTLLSITGMATTGMDNDGRGGEEEAVPVKDQAWIESVKAVQEYPDYVAMKAKMMADYEGKPDKIPMPVRTAFNRVAELTKPKD